eukprot:6293938-Alexandrium_andersonii.AAC.1
MASDAGLADQPTDHTSWRLSHKSSSASPRSVASAPSGRWMGPTLCLVLIQDRPSRTAVRTVRRRGRRPSSALRSERRWACSASQ